jgi:hypothetical protein
VLTSLINFFASRRTEGSGSGVTMGVIPRFAAFDEILLAASVCSLFPADKMNLVAIQIANIRAVVVGCKVGS